MSSAVLVQMNGVQRSFQPSMKFSMEEMSCLTLVKVPRRTATIRRQLTVPARIATSARRLHLHLPSHWPWEAAWSAL